MMYDEKGLKRILFEMGERIPLDGDKIEDYVMPDFNISYIAGIGCNDVICDSVGPLSASLLADKELNIPIFGNDINLVEKDFIRLSNIDGGIFIDASTSNDTENLGKIILGNSLKPGAGLGKKHTMLYGVCLFAITAVYKDIEGFMNLSMRERQEIMFFQEKNKYIEFLDDSEIFMMSLRIASMVEEFLFQRGIE